MLFLRRALPVAIALLGTTSVSAAPADTVRFATFNASLNRNAVGDLLVDTTASAAASVDTSVAYPDGASISGLTTAQRRVLQTHYVAEVLQRVNADVVLVNEFDFDAGGVGTSSSVPSALGYVSGAHQGFANNYLAVGHGGGSTGRTATTPLTYAHGYTPTTNTGIASGFDLNNNGVVVNTSGAPGYGDDAFGFGNFAGQFGFTIYSKYEITGVRTFQNFLWKDMPDNLLTNDSTAGPNNLANFYSPDEINVLRLSSKNHVDITLNIDGTEVHFLTAHPTPPVFDGAEDRNGKRNFDEIRFWRDYVNGESYIYDDAGGTGGLAAGAMFVIAGDYNADPCDGDSFKVACVAGLPGSGPNAILQLLADPALNQVMNPFSSMAAVPSSDGGLAAATDPSNNGTANAAHQMPAQFDTADFSDAAPGNLRVDYVLPSVALEVVESGVFWPTRNDANFPLVGTFGNLGLFAGFPTSDHKAVFVDVRLPGQTQVPAPGLIALGVIATLVGLRRRE